MAERRSDDNRHQVHHHPGASAGPSARSHPRSPRSTHHAPLAVHGIDGPEPRDVDVLKRRCALARDDRARLREARRRQATRAPRRPPPSAQRDARQHPAPHGTSRGASQSAPRLTRRPSRTIPSRAARRKGPRAGPCAFFMQQTAGKRGHFVCSPDKLTGRMLGTTAVDASPSAANLTSGKGRWAFSGLFSAVTRG